MQFKVSEEFIEFIFTIYALMISYGSLHNTCYQNKSHLWHHDRIAIIRTFPMFENVEIHVRENAIALYNQTFKEAELEHLAFSISE